jgi:tRNA dimethylallyltransferase
VKHSPLLVIAGPTASGKTAVAVEVAKRINGEVVSADSMQVYRGMDIGTAKPTADEKGGIPHHMLDVALPDEEFSAARYQQMAICIIADIHSRDKIPILAGGTGFYINAVVYRNEFIPQDDAETAYRAALRDVAHEKGSAFLHERLREIDPAAAAAIHPHNIKRVARALSFFHSTGGPISGHNASQRRNAPAYPLLYVVLDMPRNMLYERIDTRVAAMFETGLAQEVQGLLQAGYHTGLTSMQGIGYKETARYLSGEWTFGQAAEAIRTSTRHYAKRQITWFKHRADEAVLWPVSPEPAMTAERIISNMSELV